MHRIFFLLCPFFVLNCVTLRQANFQGEERAEVYKVQRGDSLASIANQFQVPMQEIMETNGLVHIGALRPGQVLFIPNTDIIGLLIEHLHMKGEKKQKAAIPAQIAPILLDFPVEDGVIFRAFSKSSTRTYPGIAIGTSLGTPIYAAAPGTVAFVGDPGTHFGLMAIIRHRPPYLTVYTHLQKALVKTGQKVGRRNQIGTIGLSGRAESPRLHFQLRVANKAIDPEPYFSSPP